MNKLLVDFYDIRNKHDKLLKSLKKQLNYWSYEKGVSMFKRFVVEFIGSNDERPCEEIQDDYFLIYI